MAGELYNNIKVNKAAPLDAKLTPVATYASLPDPTVESNFLYVGAEIFVVSENASYRVENVSNVKTWVKQEALTLVQGSINITTSTTLLDLSLVVPAIASCSSVLINIIDGNNATISAITNLPLATDMAFFTATGKTVTFKHTDYTSANTGQIILEDGNDLKITGRSIANESLILRRNSTALVQVGATQFIKTGEWSSTVLNLVVEDSLTSAATNRALSANQGRILNTTKQDKISVLPTQRLTFSGNTLTLLPYTKNLISVNWTTQKITAAVLNTPAMLADLVNTDSIVDISNNDRYIVMTPSYGEGIGKALDFGIWLLPAGLSAASSSNWFLVEAPNSVLQVQYDLVPVSDTNLANTTNGFRTLKIDKTTALGALKNFIDVDTFSGANSFYSFKFRDSPVSYSNIYEIEYEVYLINNSTTHRDIDLNLLKLPNGLIVSGDVNTYPAGYVTVNTNVFPYNGGTQGTAGNKMCISTKKRVEIQGSTSPAFSALLSTTMASTYYSNISISSGSLRITKIK